MPRITYARRNGWKNYHLTVGTDIEEYGSYDAHELGPCDAISSLSGPERFRATRDPLHGFVCKAMRQKTQAGMLGTAWSFAALVGNHDLELDLTGLRGCSIATAADMHPRSPFEPDEVALVSGGTTLRCLVEWARDLRPMRSIMTSGTHLGPTVAGGFGTASHGSRLDFGGLQDMVIGMHLITGENESVWIERASAPVLSDQAASLFATRIVHSDAQFEDALVHLGGMGIVNGVALRLVPYHDYNVLAVVAPLWPEWARQVEQGRFTEIATRLGHPAGPAFYECTIDPFDNDGVRNAIHLMYFVAPSGLLPPDGGNSLPMLPRAADAIAAFAEYMLLQPLAADPQAENRMFSAFSFYEASFRQAYAEFTLPIGPATPKRGWDRLHGDVITSGLPGALYNASFAVKRSEVSRALPLIVKAARDLKPAFLYTFRFVTDAAGTLAFTRFPETAVIEIDGVSDNAPEQVRHLGVHTKTGAMKIRTEFDIAGLEYSMHWAKLGQLDAAKVERDFGPANSTQSRIGRWRATRAALLDPDARALFVNEALRSYGLLP